jgi:opacity protein-like surface antigen
MLKFGFGVASAALATAFAAGAASAQGSYVSVGAGYTQLDSVDTVIENGVSANTDMNMTFGVDEDYSIRAAYGLVLGTFRVEGEFSYGNYDLHSYDSRVPANVSRTADGSVGMMTAMANGYVDFGDASGFKPYLGAGLGAMRTEFEAAGPLPTAPSGPIVTIVDDDQINLAWQLMAGFSIPLGGNTSLTGQYRYFDAGSYSMTAFAGHASHVDVKGSSLDVGVRIGF